MVGIDANCNPGKLHRRGGCFTIPSMLNLEAVGSLHSNSTGPSAVKVMGSYTSNLNRIVLAQYHMRNIKGLSEFASVGLTLSPDKGDVGFHSIELFEHHVDPFGLTTKQSKIATFISRAVRQPRPAVLEKK